MTATRNNRRAGPEASSSFRLLHESDRRARRRLLPSALAAVLVTALAFTLAPAESPLSKLEARRFGYFGPTRMVPEIQVREDLAEIATDTPEGTEVRSVEIEPETVGGADAAQPDREGPAPGENPIPRFDLEGGADAELRRNDLPVVKSEDLVIETLVKPRYPEEAQVLGLEGQVQLEALVDEQGRVRSIRLIENTGHPMFERVCRDAVMKCRFAPYEQSGRATSVYARFTFTFKLI